MEKIYKLEARLRIPSERLIVVELLVRREFCCSVDIAGLDPSCLLLDTEGRVHFQDIFTPCAILVDAVC